ncbi:hypothetical protein D9M71_715610 [compost metagenome]
MHALGFRLRRDPAQFLAQRGPAGGIGRPILLVQVRHHQRGVADRAVERHHAHQVIAQIGQLHV